MSPSIAKDAVVPPVVGSVHNEIYGIFLFDNWVSFADVLAICIKEIAPSIILAPPDFEIIKSGDLVFIEWSTALDIFSPTTDPIDPPI